ncbi:putative splicing factor, arginine/serine-rich 7 [Bulinus truncatus]|nr:putative splicing factor, arginine/serine-rich 7 [Bulinus truncatus]
MSEKLDTRVIQVTNVAPSCTNEQMRTLFSYLGRVKELKMYPPENTEGVVARVAYIEFDDSVTTGVALHLSGTVFIDRALMVVPVMDGKIPDEHTALQLTPQAVAGMLPGQPTWPANVVSQVTGTGINQVITTYDPRLTSLGLPQYPPLPATTDASKIEEIRRTVYVSDLDPAVTAEMLLTFFSQVGEIKYIRLAGDQRAAARGAYIEFTDQRSVAQALTYNNVVFQSRTMSVQHSKTNIVKPISGKINEASQREIDEAMKKVKEASKLISAAASESKKEASHSPTRKRSRSKSKIRSHSPSRRSRSRSKGRRRRTRSRSRRRSRSRHRSPRRSKSPVRRRRSRSRGRVVPSAPPPLRRSRSRERRRSRSRSPLRRRRSRTRSRSRRRSRTPPRSYSKRSRSRSRRKSPSPSRRRSRSRDRKERIKERKKSISLSPPHLERSGSIPAKEVEADKDNSPVKIESSANAEGDSVKISTKKRSPTPLKARRISPSPRKSPRRRSRSRSPSRRKRRRRTRSPTPRKRSRSRSGSRSRPKRERSKRSRSRERKHESKKKSGRDKEDKKKDSGSTKVKRDYDEEEKGFASGSEKEKENSDEGTPSPPTLEPGEKDSDHQTFVYDIAMYNIFLYMQAVAKHHPHQSIFILYQNYYKF